MKKRPRFLLLLSCASIAGVLATAAVAVEPWASAPEPGRAGSQLYPQRHSTSDAGLTVTALGATFSGTETMLNLRVEVQGEPVQFRIPPAAFVGDGFVPGPAGEVSSLGDGSAVVGLPPITRPGNVRAAFTSIVLTDGDIELVDGSWTLDIAGPAAAEFQAVMAIEVLTPATIDVNGEQVLVTGKRSTSRTIIEYSLPAGLRELVAPRIAVQGTVYTAISVDARPDAFAASFPVTRAGAPITFELGPFAMEGDAESPVTIDIERVLDRAERDSGTFIVTPEDVTKGNRDLVLAISIGERNLGTSAARSSDDRLRPQGNVKVLGLTIAGNWHGQSDPADPGNAFKTTPALFDSHGLQLFHMGGTVGYTKDASGAIGPGETLAEFWVEAGAEIRTVTLVLGPPSRVVAGEWRAELSPAPERR